MLFSREVRATELRCEVGKTGGGAEQSGVLRIREQVTGAGNASLTYSKAAKANRTTAESVAYSEAATSAEAFQVKDTLENIAREKSFK